VKKELYIKKHKKRRFIVRTFKTISLVLIAILKHFKTISLISIAKSALILLGKTSVSCESSLDLS
jgi:hypothetical protein